MPKFGEPTERGRKLNGFELDLDASCKTWAHPSMRSRSCDRKPYPCVLVVVIENPDVPPFIKVDPH